jgi:hypothetical protein
MHLLFEYQIYPRVLQDQFSNRVFLVEVAAVQGSSNDLISPTKLKMNDLKTAVNNTRTTIFESSENQTDLSLLHLQCELTRVDLLLRREVMRWQLAGQDPADCFRGLYISDADADSLLERPFGTNWGYNLELDPSEEFSFHQALDLAAQQSQAITEMAQEQGVPLRLSHLAREFELDSFDLDVLLICLAPALDLRYERLYGYLQDDVTRKRPGVSLVLDLLCEPGLERFALWSHFSPDAPLFKHCLIELIPDCKGQALLSQALAPDPTLIAWLLGHYQPHNELVARAHLLESPRENGDWSHTSEIQAGLKYAVHDKAILVFYGPDQAGQETTAIHIAASMERPLLRVDMGALLDDGLSPSRALKLVLRDARLTGALPFLIGWDDVLGKSFAPPPQILSDLCEHPDLVIIAGGRIWQAKGIRRQRHLNWTEFPIPAYVQRRQEIKEHSVANRLLMKTCSPQPALTPIQTWPTWRAKSSRASPGPTSSCRRIK